MHGFLLPCFVISGFGGFLSDKFLFMNKGDSQFPCASLAPLENFNKQKFGTFMIKVHPRSDSI